jgi:cyclopropane fatty-acyl-phospholipid synthase-like methyltransferase
MANNWREFWSGEHSIYANKRHKDAHNAIILHDMLVHIQPFDHVLDFGCGEALLADALVPHCASLTLCDGAESVLTGLRTRLSGQCTIVSPEELETVTVAFDKIFMVSVLQYLSHDEFSTRLSSFKRLLKPNGTFYIADVIPPDVGMVKDTLSLLKMAFQHGFLFAACLSLVKTALSNYRQLRAKFGLTQFTKPEIIAFLKARGFKAEILAHNISPHQHRFTVKVTVYQKQ